MFLYLDFVDMIWCFRVGCNVPFHSVFCYTWLTWMKDPSMPVLFLNPDPNWSTGITDVDMNIPAGDAVHSPRFLFVLFSLTCTVALAFGTVSFHLWLSVYWPAAFSSFLPFLLFSTSDAHMLLPCNGTMWIDLMPFLLPFLYPLFNWQCRVPSAAAFDVIFLLLDLNLAAENCAWYLTTTPGTLCCPGIHFRSAVLFFYPKDGGSWFP